MRKFCEVETAVSLLDLVYFKSKEIFLGNILWNINQNTETVRIVPLVFLVMVVTNKTQEPWDWNLLHQHVVKMPTILFCLIVLKRIVTA